MKAGQQGTQVFITARSLARRCLRGCKLCPATPCCGGLSLKCSIFKSSDRAAPDLSFFNSWGHDNRVFVQMAIMAHFHTPSMALGTVRTFVPSSARFSGSAFDSGRRSGRVLRAAAARQVRRLAPNPGQPGSGSWLFLQQRQPVRNVATDTPRGKKKRSSAPAAHSGHHLRECV